MHYSRRFVLPFAALFQIAGSAAPQVFGWGMSIGEQSRLLDTAIVPAGWAFSIWGPIFLWSIAFAMYAATRPVGKLSVANKVTWPAIGAFMMNGVWALYTPFLGLNLGSEFIIVIGLICALLAAVIAGRTSSKSLADRLLVAAPMGLLAGWLTAASFVGGSSVLLGLGVAMTDVLLLTILTSVSSFAVLIILLRPSITYSLSIIWALAAIIAKNSGDGNETIIYAAGGAIIVVSVVALISSIRRK